MRSSVHPEGKFLVGKHAPAYRVKNLRQEQQVMSLGHVQDGPELFNTSNFPNHDIEVEQGRVIYEVANAFFFRGATYIDSGWASAAARGSRPIRIETVGSQPSTRQTLAQRLPAEKVEETLLALPLAMHYSMAASSTDPKELVILARHCCSFEYDGEGLPTGLVYTLSGHAPRPEISDFELFETIANNPCLPDVYKEVMVLRPGVQGNSPIVGEYRQEQTHVYEYLRANSYIPWGHYAANCAQDCIRYAITDVSLSDMRGLRHLYYQRAYVQMGAYLGVVSAEHEKGTYSVEELEDLRENISKQLVDEQHPPEIATLWGWNFGYDYSGTGYRLHASHQMIHQQYAFVPEEVQALSGEALTPFSCGDMVADHIEWYRTTYSADFFTDYLRAIRSNSRIDGNDGPESLVIWENEHVLVFVPKAQVSQWEVQIMVTQEGPGGPVGNIFEASTAVRESLDTALLQAQRALAGLGATMVTSIEFSKRCSHKNGQRLLYSLLPKLPWSMGAFSEAQSRYICGHYPEDFAQACREALGKGVVEK